MTKVVITHPVKDVKHWLSKNSERVEMFAEWGSNVVGYGNADESNMVALTIDVKDMEAMERSLASAEIDAAKKAHGVLEPVSLFVASE